MTTVYMYSQGERCKNLPKLDFEEQHPEYILQENNTILFQANTVYFLFVLYPENTPRKQTQ